MLKIFFQTFLLELSFSEPIAIMLVFKKIFFVMKYWEKTFKIQENIRTVINLE